MARLTESDLRRIVRQEASRMVKGARKPLREGMWYGGYDDSDLVYLDSGDKGLDEAWAAWATSTKELLERAGGMSFGSEGPEGDVTVKDMRSETIGYF